MILEFLLGFTVALMLNAVERGKNVYYLILLFPLLMNPVVVGLIWRMFLHPVLGIVNYLLSTIGIGAVNWLGDPSNAFWTIVLVDIWHQVSFMIVLLLAGLSALPREPYEAARMEGASTLQTFLHVTLPLMRPVIVVTLLIRLIFAVRTYDLIYIMTRGGPGQATDLVSYFIYRQAFVSLNIGQASAMSVILLLIVLALTAYLLSLHALAGVSGATRWRHPAERVSKVYPGGVTAVDGIDLEIKDGEFMILLGPSGCGKSTTLRMIAGLETITSGDLYIGAERVNEVDPRDRNLAFVFQNYALFPHMTVARQSLLRHAHPRPREGEIEARVRDVARLLGIGELLARKPGELSGGQRQRVALGRALVRDPVAFLLDEPLSNLDAKLRASMRTELIKLHRQLGRTMIHVTHDQVEAMTMGERICIMNDGRIVQVGPPMEVYRNPADTFVAGFLASPPMNLLAARVEAAATGSGLAVVCSGLRLPLVAAPDGPEGAWRDRPVILGIRPEDIRETPERSGGPRGRSPGHRGRGARARGDPSRQPARPGRARDRCPNGPRLQRANRELAACGDRSARNSSV